MDMDGIVEMASAAPDALIPNSAPLASPSEAAAAVDVTLDVRNDAVAVHGDSARPATGAAVGGDDSGARAAAAPARTESNKGLKFISLPDGGAGWPAVEKRFNKLSQSGRLHRHAFGKCIGTREDEFAGELFDVLARRRNITGYSISRAELREFWDQISDTSFDDIRLQTFFDMVVKNADGRITESELREIITLSASTNRILQIEQQAEEYARLIMKELDPSNLGYIAIEDLEIRLPQPPRQKKLSGQSGLLSSMAEPSNPLGRWYRRAKHLIDDNWKRLWVILLWISTCVGLFTWKFLQYRRRRHAFEVMGYCICAAEGGAETLKFNLALVLLPVCRNTITWLRTHTTLVAHVMPLDDSINFHSLVAAGIAVGAGIHAISHLACGFPRLLHATDANSYWWLVMRSTEGWTGLVMVVLMAVAFVLATPPFRRGRLWMMPEPLRRLIGFNAFWYSHHCFVLVYALLVVHGHYGRLYLANTSSRWYNRSTWMYLAVPMLLYACERFARVLRSTVLLPVKILEVVLYPGNILSLHFSKPQGFQYKSGQHIFINCPAISLFQWHPFWITSAPQDNYVSVHIQTLGDWTREVNNIFSTVCRPPMEGRSGLLRAEYNCDGDTMLNPSFPKLLIDGPYGSTAQDYEKYDVVLLISLGIGVGGMISIIKDIINNLKQFDGDLESGDTRKNYVPSSFRTRRAYFYWITRVQGSFEWFHNVMDEVVQMDKKGVIEFHNYCTSLYDESDARSALIAMLQSLNFAKNGIDIISGTRVKTHFGRPKWSNVYKRIALNHRDQCVGVFYCGAPVLEEELRDVARDFSRKTTTKFEFHKENF